jgi:hypothetical protein
MKAPWLPAAPVTLAAGWGDPRAATGEPITATYNVHVSARDNWATATTEPFSADFVLQMRFDPALGPISCDDECRYGVSTYGPVSFSHVPLSVATPPATMQLAENGFTNHHEVNCPPASGCGEPSFGVVAMAEHLAHGRDDLGNPGPAQAVFYSDLILLSATDIVTRAVLSPETFVTDLARPTQHSNGFNFQYTGVNGILGEDGRYHYTGYTYYGSLAARTAPTPEPATLILTTAGIALVVRRRAKSGVRSSDT